MTPSARYTLIEPLRGVAALWVFAYHYDFSLAFQTAFPLLHAALKMGHLGVPMFFVISGYCITASAQSSLRRGERTSAFLSRRLLRIYPPYWCAVLVCAAVPFVLAGLTALKAGHQPPTTDVRANGFLNYSALDWLEVLSLTRAFDPQPVDSLQEKFNTINAVFWTLAIEVQFYLVMATAVALRVRLAPALTGVTAVALPFLFVPASFTWGVFLPYWPQFAFGSLVYALLASEGPAGLWLRRGLGGIALAGGIAAVFVIAAQGGKIPDLAFAAGFALVLWLGRGLDAWYEGRVAGSRRRGVRAANRLLTTLGAMSYSIYLLHGRVRFVAMQVLRQVLPADSIAFDAGVFLLTCGVCYGFYLLCERPFIGGRRAGPATVSAT
ncbi:acyltransferase family protein [Limnoglobus roseus]|uniref:Acyltransferase n=1 Tax=Limnoglobus roseus TaxID=2598579 RepID=A0A5C1A8A5_9BACT|nr:acyltransferase [Limnoglobus roseus]QEL15559.1 acyltransferase [Limnoglobus roseus]